MMRAGHRQLGGVWGVRRASFEKTKLVWCFLRAGGHTCPKYPLGKPSEVAFKDSSQTVGILHWRINISRRMGTSRSLSPILLKRFLQPTKHPSHLKKMCNALVRESTCCYAYRTWTNRSSCRRDVNLCLMIPMVSPAMNLEPAPVPNQAKSIAKTLALCLVGIARRIPANTENVFAPVN